MQLLEIPLVFLFKILHICWYNRDPKCEVICCHTCTLLRKIEEERKRWRGCSPRNKTWNFYSLIPLIFHWPALSVAVLSHKEGLKNVVLVSCPVPSYSFYFLQKNRETDTQWKLAVSPMTILTLYWKWFFLVIQGLWRSGAGLFNLIIRWHLAVLPATRNQAIP